MVSKTLITARYGETDMMGIVHHSVYAMYYEQARVDFIKQFGVTYKQLEEDGLMMPLISLECKYKKPLKFADEFTVETKVEEIKPSRIKFGYRILNSDGEVINTGSTEHGFVSSSTFKPINAKRLFPELYSQLSGR